MDVIYEIIMLVIYDKTGMNMFFRLVQYDKFYGGEQQEDAWNVLWC